MASTVLLYHHSSWRELLLQMLALCTCIVPAVVTSPVAVALRCATVVHLLLHLYRYT